MALNEDDIRRARTYISMPNLTTVYGCAEWIEALCEEVTRLQGEFLKANATSPDADLLDRVEAMEAELERFYAMEQRVRQLRQLRHIEGAEQAARYVLGGQ